MDTRAVICNTFTRHYIKKITGNHCLFGSYKILSNRTNIPPKRCLKGQEISIASNCNILKNDTIKLPCSVSLTNPKQNQDTLQPFTLGSILKTCLANCILMIKLCSNTLIAAHKAREHNLIQLSPPWPRSIYTVTNCKTIQFF